jgi:hypothetical protein
MKVQVTEAQVWWIAIADEIRAREGLSWRVWFDAIQKVFQFAQVPTSLPQAGSGFEFKEGSLKTDSGALVVTAFQVYQDGLSVVVPSTTRNADTALQAALEVFLSIGVREPVTPSLHYYVSSIVADFDKSLDNLIPQWLLKSLSNAMPIEGVAHFLALHSNFDASKIRGRLGPINPTNFRLERRIGIPYDQNRYFSLANTTTEKHLDLLEEIERSI